MDQKHMALASFTMAGVGDASAKTRPQAGRWRNLSPDQDVAPPPGLHGQQPTSGAGERGRTLPHSDDQGLRFL